MKSTEQFDKIAAYGGSFGPLEGRCYRRFNSGRIFGMSGLDKRRAIA
jgi:hypothetical protein